MLDPSLGFRQLETAQHRELYFLPGVVPRTMLRIQQ